MYFFILRLGIFSFSVYLFACYIGRRNSNYWKKRGVKFYNKSKVMGPSWDFFTGNRAMFEIIGDIYKSYPDEPAVGVGSFLAPMIFVSNPKNVEYIMKGNILYDRGLYFHEKYYLADNVSFMSGPRWKLMKQKMTPLFTTSKLRNMYYIIDKSAQDFIEYLRKHPEKQKGVNYDTLCTFCCAAFSGAVFGVRGETKFDSPFLEMIRKSFSPEFWNIVKLSILTTSPALFKALRLKLFKQFEPFFIGAIKQALKEREEEGVKKHDFIDLCLKLKNNGIMEDKETGMQLEPTDELLAAQGFFFFSAGVEPTATVIFGAMIEIGRHPDVQRRLQEEIDSVFVKYSGQLSYDATAEMVYLDKVISESLRMYPPIGYILRRCEKTTALPEGNIKTDKGTTVLIPVHAYHYDPRYYKNPYTFDPERFSKESKQNVGVLYQPFGYGSRKCIGIRYAQLQIKSALAHILRHFNLVTHIGNGGIKYAKDHIQLQMKNVDILYTPRINQIS